MHYTCARVLTVAALAGLLWSPVTTATIAADQDDSKREGGSPVETRGPQPRASYKGMNAGEWLAVWWQTVFATPVEGGSHPLIDGGAFGGNNRMVFLGGPVQPAGSPMVTTRVTIPSGTHLVVPIITVECSVAEAPPFHGEDEAQLRACANGLLDLVTDPYAEIDDRPVTDPDAHRVETPLFRYGPLPAENVLGLPPGTQSDAVAAGYVLLLQPLSVGVHRIRTRAEVPAFGIAADAEIIVNVEPQQKS
jgi:hypothetical protein